MSVSAPTPRRSCPSATQQPSRTNQSPLQMLLQMGFSQKRAQKALSATGDRSVQLASDWLAARLNDPLLDESAPREYVLYMRPSGPLSMQIYRFWEDVLETVGRNAAQNLMPHITLCSYFKVADDFSGRLGEMLVSAASTVLSSSALPLPLPLEKYTSHNYMGLFATSPAAPLLQSIRRHFMQSASSLSSSGLCSGGVEEDLHLTLAYGYSVAQFAKLEALVKSIQVTAPATWELCLYSREPRFNGYDLYRSVRGHDPGLEDELLLLSGDYVYVSGEDAATTTDGWLKGTSWLTGCTGLVPLAYLVRVPDSDTWTLHRGVTINVDGKGIEITDGTPVDESLFEDACDGFNGGCQSGGYGSGVCGAAVSTSDAGVAGDRSGSVQRSGLSLSLLNLLDHSEGSRRSTTAYSDASSCDRLHSRQASVEAGVPPPLSQHQLDQLYAKVHKTVRKQLPLFNFPINGPRKLYVMRHGERADFTFGDWCKRCYNENGQYSRADLNLQATVPSRADAPRTFIKDGPLTRVGELQALLVGEGFASTQTVVHHVFCSPSLRCVMTATNVLKAMNIADRMPLKIEPGLFEWLAWYPEGVPRFMTLDELRAAGHNVDPSYHPVLADSQLPPDESCEQYYTRSGHVTNALLAATAHQGGSVLLVAHGASLDTCIKQLLGGHPRTSSNMIALLKKVPYCALATAEESPVEGLWNLVEPPFRSPTHSVNHSYDWTMWRH